MGVRTLIRLFEMEIFMPISRLLLIQEGEVALVWVQDDTLIVERKVHPTNYQQEQ